MVCFQEANIAETLRGAFLSASVFLFLSSLFFSLSFSLLFSSPQTIERMCHSQAAVKTYKYTGAVTYICWVWWMPTCKFFKRFSQWELEGASLLAEFLSLGPRCLAPPLRPDELRSYRHPAPHHCTSWLLCCLTTFIRGAVVWGW